MDSVDNLLQEILAIINRSVTVGYVDQKNFLNKIFKIGKKEFNNKSANRIFRNDRNNTGRINLHQQCSDSEITNRIRKALNDWRVDDLVLKKELETLINFSDCFTYKEKAYFRKLKKVEILVRELLSFALGERNIYFFHEGVEERFFVGRKREIQEVDEILQNKGYCYLYGINGYGKTTLARKIGRGENYDDFIELKYSTNIKDSLMKCKQFPSNMGSEERVLELKKLGEEYLIIVDDINESYKTESDEFFKFLDKLPLKKIFITNYKIEDSDESFYHIDALGDEELIKLFDSNVNKLVIDQEVKTEIINSVFKNTFLVKLCSKLLEKGMITPKNMIEELRRCIFTVSDSTLIQLDKYEKEATYNQFIVECLYNISNLNEEELKFLFVLWMFRKYGIEKHMLLELMGYKDANILNSLIKKGWIERQDHDQISIHAIIADCIKNKRKEEKEKAEEVSNEMVKNANCCLHDSTKLSLRWVLAYYDIAVSLTNNNMDVIFLQYVFEMLLVEYPNITYLKCINDIITEAIRGKRTYYSEFYAKQNSNIIEGFNGNFESAIYSEINLLSSSANIYWDTKKKNILIMASNFIMKCLMTIRRMGKQYRLNNKNIENVEKRLETVEEFEYVWALDFIERFNADPEIRKKCIVTDTYFLDYYTYCLLNMNLSESERNSMKDYLVGHATNPHVFIILCEINATFAIIEGDLDLAKAEILNAIDVAESLDSPLNYVECRWRELFLDFHNGVDKKQILMEVEKLEKEYCVRQEAITGFYCVEKGINLLKKLCSDVPE